MKSNLWIIIVTLMICEFTFCSAGDKRNDLIVDRADTIYGKLNIDFHDTKGFSRGIRNAANYNIPLRFDEIPVKKNGAEIYIKLLLYLDSSRKELIFDGKWIHGKIKRREKYHDYLLGRYLDVNLDFKEHFLVVQISPNPSKDQKTEIELAVKPKRIEKNSLLDMF